MCVEVFKRYILNAPTAWIYDANNMLYGTLFMLAGAYALAQNAHVRGDFLYGSMRPRTQAALDLVLYIVFFLPGIAALLYAGYHFAEISWRIGEHSSVMAEGPPIYPFKTVIPIAGALDHPAGPRRDRALRRLPAHRRSGRAGCTTSRRWTSSRSSSRTASTSTTRHAGGPSQARNKIEETARQRGMAGDLQT